MDRNNKLFIIILTVSSFLVLIKGDIKRDCRKQTNVSWASLKKLKAGNFDQDDPRLKCYLKCFMMKNGIINDNSEINVDKAIRHLPPNMQDSSRKILQRCKSVRGQNSCDKAFQIAKCYVKSKPNILKNVSFV